MEGNALPGVEVFAGQRPGGGPAGGFHGDMIAHQPLVLPAPCRSVSAMVLVNWRAALLSRPKRSNRGIPLGEATCDPPRAANYEVPKVTIRLKLVSVGPSVALYPEDGRFAAGDFRKHRRSLDNQGAARRVSLRRDRCLS
jgi:hypothetical protein